MNNPIKVKNLVLIWMIKRKSNDQTQSVNDMNENDETEQNDNNDDSDYKMSDNEDDDNYDKSYDEREQHIKTSISSHHKC